MERGCCVNDDVMCGGGVHHVCVCCNVCMVEFRDNINPSPSVSLLASNLRNTDVGQG